MTTSTPSEGDSPRGPVTDPAETGQVGEPPQIAGDRAWTPSASPMGEGSDDTAVPDVDPAERRLSDE